MAVSLGRGCCSASDGLDNLELGEKIGLDYQALVKHNIRQRVNSHTSHTLKLIVHSKQKVR